MKVSFKFMAIADDDAGVAATADYERDAQTLELPDGPRDFSLSHIRRCLDKPYHIPTPSDGWRTSFTDAEKRKLRPIAETLALLDGNAFFGTHGGGEAEHYECYLAEAYHIYESNGGDTGWAGAASFAKAAAA